MILFAQKEEITSTEFKHYKGAVEGEARNLILFFV